MIDEATAQERLDRAVNALHEIHSRTIVWRVEKAADVLREVNRIATEVLVAERVVTLR